MSTEEIRGRRKFFFNTAIMIFDAVVVNIAVISAFLLRYNFSPPDRNIQAYKEIFILLTIIRILCMYISDLYLPNLKKFARSELVARVSISSVAGTIFIVLVAFYNRSFAFPRTIVIISMITDILFVLLFRGVLRLVILKEYKRNLLIAGTGAEARLIARDINRYSNGDYNILGFLAEPDCQLEKQIEIEDSGQFPVFDDPLIIMDKSLPSVLEDLAVHDLVIALGTDYYNHIIKLIDRYSKKGTNIRLLPNLYEIFAGRVNVGEVAGIPLVEITDTTSGQWQKLAKKVIDFILSLLAIIILAPLMLLVTIIIKVTSKGPAIYVQERLMRPGRTFRLYKFRSMVVEAEKTSGPQMAQPADPRVTPFGRWMRKYRIDEIPQLFNVLKGDMSLVGPRPERDHFVNQFLDKVEGYHRRFEMKPGLTGLAQIHGRYDTSVENKLRYDLIFINNWSLLLDVKIMLLTVRVIFSGHGGM